MRPLCSSHLKSKQQWWWQHSLSPDIHLWAPPTHLSMAHFTSKASYSLWNYPPLLSRKQILLVSWAPYNLPRLHVRHTQTPLALTAAPGKPWLVFPVYQGCHQGTVYILHKYTSNIFLHHPGKSGAVSVYISSVQFSSGAQSCPILWNPMDSSLPGFPVHHQLP